MFRDTGQQADLLGYGKACDRRFLFVADVGVDKEPFAKVMCYVIGVHKLLPRASDSVSALAALAALIPGYHPPLCVQLAELSSALSDFFSSHKLTDQRINYCYIIALKQR